MSSFHAFTRAKASRPFASASPLSRGMHAAAVLALSTCFTPAHAAVTTFEFSGVVSGLSDSATFGGASLGQSIRGVLSYEQSAVPIKTVGTWSASYDLSTPGTQLSVTLPDGQLFQLGAFGAKVFDGPVYPLLNNDQFIVGVTYLDPTAYVKSGQALAMGLSFDGGANLDSLTSSVLPTSLDLSKMRYSGGVLNVITGTQAPGDDIYIVNRSSMAFVNGIWDASYPTSSVQRFSRSTPSQPSTYIVLDGYLGQGTYASPDLERYRSWLAAGNTPLYLDALGFQMTSISTVPEPQGNALMACGCMVLLWLARRRA